MKDTRLIVSPVNYGKQRELMEDFVFMSFKVDKGFITDGASIPRAFWGIIEHPFGQALEAAVLHDFLYFRGLLTRKQCDKIFLRGMKKLKVFGPKRWAMHRAVRMFGWIGWNKYRNDEKKERDKIDAEFDPFNAVS